MNALVFRDVHGQIGTVTTDLDIAYQGHWQADIEDCVERIEQTCPQEDVFGQIVVALPVQAPVKEVERVSSSYHTER